MIGNRTILIILTIAELITKNLQFYDYEVYLMTNK